MGYPEASKCLILVHWHLLAKVEKSWSARACVGGFENKINKLRQLWGTKQTNEYLPEFAFKARTLLRSLLSLSCEVFLDFTL